MMDLRDSLEEPVSTHMSKSYARVRGGDPVSSAAKSMQDLGVTEAVVVEGGEPVGIVTEKDILYKVVARGSDPSKVWVKDVMSSPVQAVEEDSKVADAISRMASMGIRRLGVTQKGKLVGLVTQKAMVSGSLGQSVSLPELTTPGQIRCPYCDAIMRDGNDLSQHIDQVHLGLGLLEGDRSKW